MEIAALLSATASTASAVYSATRDPPKPPSPMQEAKAPGLDAFRNRARQRSPAQIAAQLAGKSVARTQLGGVASGNAKLGV